MKASQSDGSVAAIQDYSVGEIAQGDWFLISPHLLIGSLGSVAMFAWLFLSLGTYAYASPDLIGVAPDGRYHFLFLSSLIVSLLVAWALADKCDGYALSLTSIVLTVAGLACSWSFSQYDAALLAGCVLFGSGLGLMYCLYGELVSWFFFNNIKRYMLGISTAAVFCVLIVMVASFPANRIMATALPLIAFVCYIIELPYLKAKMPARILAKDSDSRCRVKLRSYLATATAGLVVGFSTGGLILSENDHPAIVAGLVALLLVVVCFALFRDAGGRNRMTETVSMRWFLPYSAVIAFPLLFVPEGWRFPFFALLLGGSMLPETCSLAAICSHVSLFNLNAIRTFSFGRFWAILGILLGAIVAYIGMGNGVFMDIEPGLRLSAAVVLFMLLVIFSASFVMTHDNYPTKADVEKSADDQGGVPIHDFLDSAAGDQADASDQEGVKPGKFYLQCEVVAKEYGLSARQREVLGMLARGRNAEYITEKLIISTHTAKAHIYNIYQKTGVHSRQELMDLVEAADVSDDSPVIKEILHELAVKQN